jgi:glycosyltransferase involved in cell wall biosynthesis
MGRRVLYVLKRFPRLSETFILHELLRLETAGVEIGVDSLRSPEPGPVHPELDGLAAPVRHLPRLPLGEQARLVADRAASEGYDQIHAHFATSAAEVAGMAGAGARLPVTVTAHAKDIFHDDYAPGLSQRLAGAAAVVTVSQHNAAHLRRLLTQPVHVVYNGISAPPLVAPDPHGPVLCVARLVPKKGIDVLIRSAGLLAEAGRAIDVEIVGDGPQRAELEALAGSIGIEDRVRFLGALPAPGVEAAYRRASMFALPCRIDAAGDRDGMPTVLGEAMLRGIPVVSTDLVGIPELLRDRETGLLVPPDDPAGLAQALDGLACDPRLAADLALKGRAHALRMLDPVTATRALCAVFTAVTG